MNSSFTTPRRLLLRLDDGCLICNPLVLGDRGKQSVEDQAAVLLSPEKCQELGRVQHADVIRAYKLLDSIRASARSAVGTLSGDQTPRNEEHRTVKRAKVARELLSPTLTAGSGGAPPPPDWEDRCAKMLNSVKEFLRRTQALHIFDRPVEANLVPDYYNIVKNPMDLGTMTRKLSQHEYTKPAEFVADMRLIWSNCSLYNKKGDFIEKSGSLTCQHFENLWGKSGLSDGNERQKRPNAGHAAAKYEPSNPISQRKAARGTTSAGGSISRRNGAGRSKKGRSDGPISRRKGGKSKTSAAPPMSRDQMSLLAQKLGQLDEDSLQGVINIIKERTHLANTDDEIELDIEALDNETLWSLDHYLNRVLGGAGPHASGAWGNDSGSDSETSTESESN
uniref:Ring3 protein n=1 Tax=Tetraselmis sp. GSL018 TaxID=582737 RepID=A0A061RAB9_9CHLO|mmetsp:Transcript_25342/g.60289  ORF Transcript_25342/g.60289 Transcript_25342/m.60289 type:complete len:393 (+) Transcript_25342:556-1734(+)